MDIYVLLFISLFSCLETKVSATGFNNNPGAQTLHENYDAAVDYWTVDATCEEENQCSYSCDYDCDCFINVFWVQLWCNTCYRTCYRTCYTPAACNRSSISTNPSNQFEMNGYLTIRKKSCNSPGCGPTCSTSGTGCVNAGESYTVGVTCYHDSYQSSTITDSFTVSVSENVAPTFYFRDGDSIDVYKSTSGDGSVVNTMVASDTDAYVDSDTIHYTLSSGPDGSWIHNNILFELDTTNGQIKVTQSLASEFSWYYTMELCVHDRREDETCHTLTITLHACFQTPNCTDQQSLNVLDTHGLWTGHGTTNTLFDMQYPTPTDHFTNFNNGWHDLTWTFVSNTLNVGYIDTDTVPKCVGV